MKFQGHAMRVPNARNAINYNCFLMILSFAIERRDREHTKIVNIQLVLKIKLKSWWFSGARFGGNQKSVFVLNPITFDWFCLKTLKTRCPRNDEIVEF